MNISPELMAKGTAGALAASAAIGAGIAAKSKGWLDFNKSVSEIQQEEKQIELTKFDQGLIDFLDEGGDIEFEVKKGNVDLSENDLTFSSTDTSLTARVSVLVGETEVKLIEPFPGTNINLNGKRITLQKINKNGAPWTWSCEVKFEASGTSLEGKSINDKDKIFSSTEEGGLFNLLKKDAFVTANEPEKEKGKSAKKRFIKACAKERGSDKNKTIETDGIPSTDNNELKSSITINLKVGVAGQGDKNDTSKLYPSGEEDDRKFKELFDEITAQQPS